ncbi:MAG TPA: glycoside hydrolase family 38 C-terminal domain-containing protein [Actinomycetes bacterium]|nr:glycoside hydrolase family 38 C-terminal domain-containing protein [Actinomycetes bacterium]
MSGPRDDVLGIRARIFARVGDLEQACVHDRMPLPVEVCDVDGAAVSPLGPAPGPDDPRWTPLQPGEDWGREHPLVLWGYPADGGSVSWLRTRFVVPPGWVGEDVLLALDDPRGGPAIGYEGLLHLDGAVLAGLDEFHRQVLLPERARSGPHDVLARCTVAARRPFAGIELRRRDPAVWRLGLLVRTLLGAIDVWDENDVELHRVVAALDQAYRALDLREGWHSERFRASAAAALPRLEASLPRGDAARPLVTAIGHAHLDVAWLWPTWRTRQKVVHTVATALHLMDRYPDYHFALSAPQTWEYVREDAPEVWERMLPRVAEGRLEPVGVMWLECDANLPSGEALVRQVKHGLAHYARWTGQQPPAAWLPDSFGYSAALPTVLAGFGIRAFLTTKLSWNQVNRMPADTFCWRGVDGSEVIAHFVTSSAADVGHPADPQWHTYNGSMTPREVAGLWAHYRGKPTNEELLYLFGHGDGGGGPTEQMVAVAGWLADLPGLPEVRLGRSDGFFDRLLARADRGSLPAWTGDLFMEGHRGTFTSQARTKRANRDLEKAAREAEWANAWAVRDGLAPDRQPVIDGAWTTLLRNQFHDILPGSSIAQVYLDAAAEQAAALATLADVRDEALRAIASGAPGPVVVNCVPWPRTEVIEHAGRARRVLVGSYGFAPVEVAASGVAECAPVRVAATAGGWVLDNGVVRAAVDRFGEIASLVLHATGREFASAALNALVLYEDRPLSWDAWDIDAFYADKPTPLREAEEVEAVDGSGLRGQVVVRRVSGPTTVVQRIALDAGSPTVTVETAVDWGERNMLLRARFPFAIAARHATAGRAFGSVEIPTHRNTSWEQGRFELPVHGWLDVSDGGGGVALLTDATYGHSVDGATVGLSLLKAGSWPDPTADAGHHRFRYALLPHAGTWQEAGVPRAAFELGAPLRLLELPARGGAESPNDPDGPDGPDGGQRCFLADAGPGILVETVKVADDGDGTVLRVVETQHAPARARLRFDRAVAEALRTDLAERVLETLSVDDGVVEVDLRPHEVLTLKVRWRL